MFWNACDMIDGPQMNVLVSSLRIKFRWFFPSPFIGQLVFAKYARQSFASHAIHIRIKKLFETGFIRGTKCHTEPACRRSSSWGLCAHRKTSSHIRSRRPSNEHPQWIVDISASMIETTIINVHFHSSSTHSGNWINIFFSNQILVIFIFFLSLFFYLYFYFCTFFVNILLFLFFIRIFHSRIRIRCSTLKWTMSSLNVQHEWQKLRENV